MILTQYDDWKQRIDAAKAETHSPQAQRLVDYLLEHGPSLTGELCQQCAIGNLSHAANCIRPALEKQGIALLCNIPKPLARNKFGQASMSHEWRLQRLR